MPRLFSFGGARMGDIVVGALVGVGARLIAAFLFAYAAFRMRPNLQVSKEVCRNSSPADGTQYLIKLLNKGRRSAYDVRARLFLLHPRGVSGGTVRRREEIPLVVDETWEIPKFNKNDKGAEYAFRFRTNKDLTSRWSADRNATLVFQVRAVDSFSGFPKVVRQEFHRVEDIKDGDFEFGDSFGIR
jgi:hypothetical protein